MTPLTGNHAFAVGAARARFIFGYMTRCRTLGMKVGTSQPGT